MERMLPYVFGSRVPTVFVVGSTPEGNDAGALDLHRHSGQGPAAHQRALVPRRPGVLPGRTRQPVEALDGRLGLEGEERRGTVATVSLPTS